MREHLKPKPGYNGACKTAQNGLEELETTETSAGNTTFYKYGILASAAKFLILYLSFSLSFGAPHSCIHDAIPSFKPWATKRKIEMKRGEKTEATEAWFFLFFFFFLRNISILLFLREWE